MKVVMVRRKAMNKLAHKSRYKSSSWSTLMNLGLKEYNTIQIKAKRITNQRNKLAILERIEVVYRYLWLFDQHKEHNQSDANPKVSSRANKMWKIIWVNKKPNKNKKKNKIMRLHFFIYRIIYGFLESKHNRCQSQK